MQEIVITDWKTMTNDDLDTTIFEKYGHVTAYPLTNLNDIATRVENADIILCNKAPMNIETLYKAKKLKLISLFATGYNNVDIDYCKNRGITVCNAGQYSTMAVAQHTFALILSIYSKVYKYSEFVKAKGWINSDVFTPFAYPTMELFNKTIGLIGYGSIAKQVAKIAESFGMRVIAYTRNPRLNEAVQFVSFDELLTQSDIVSVHCPLNAQSEKMFNEEAFNKMKKNSVFINTARGGIVDENALSNALKTAQIKAAAIDTIQIEPMNENNILLDAPNLIITPHTAWAAYETRVRLMNIVADNIKGFLEGNPKNVII